jgi:hypothetical protein
MSDREIGYMDLVPQARAVPGRVVIPVKVQAARFPTAGGSSGTRCVSGACHSGMPRIAQRPGPGWAAPPAPL